MSFDLRKEKGNKAVNVAIDWLNKHEIQFKDISVENNYTPQELRELIKRKDRTSIYELSRTDIIIFGNNSSWYVDFKNSYAIEKGVYEIYSNLSKQDCKIGLIIFYTGNYNKSFWKNKLFFCEIKDLVFKEAEPFIIWPLSKPVEIPIENKIWYSPNLLSEEHLEYYKRKIKGSGKPFANIDYKNTKLQILAEYDTESLTLLKDYF